jgi:aminoglycoside 6'-N-acetyltransferase I
MISIIPVDAACAEEWLRMRCALWPDEDRAECQNDVEDFLAGKARHLLAVFVARDDIDGYVGFAEMNIRPYAEECHTDRIAFLEGWYVIPSARRKGVGRALLHAAEQWAREQRCTEFASDGYAGNQLGTAAHIGLGFKEVGLIRCFRKELKPTAARLCAKP